MISWSNIIPDLAEPGGFKWPNIFRVQFQLFETVLFTLQSSIACTTPQPSPISFSNMDLRFTFTMNYSFPSLANRMSFVPGRILRFDQVDSLRSPETKNQTILVPKLMPAIGIVGLFAELFYFSLSWTQIAVHPRGHPTTSSPVVGY